jgi:hypothetical protein
MANKQKNRAGQGRQPMSVQQIIFVVISILIILAWVLGSIFGF